MNVEQLSGFRNSTFVVLAIPKYYPLAWQRRNAPLWTCLAPHTNRHGVNTAIAAPSSPSCVRPYAWAFTAQTLAFLAAHTTQSNTVEAWHMAARWSARASFGVFLLVLTYPWFLTHRPNLLGPPRMRRHWGLAFAFSHFAHLSSLLVYLQLSGVVVGAATRIGGAIAFGLLALLVATSNDRSRSLLGRGWLWLHRLGIYYLWVVFTISYIKRAVDPERVWIGSIGVLASAVALGLRIANGRTSASARSFAD